MLHVELRSAKEVPVDAAEIILLPASALGSRKFPAELSERSQRLYEKSMKEWKDRKAKDGVLKLTSTHGGEIVALWLDSGQSAYDRHGHLRRKLEPLFSDQEHETIFLDLRAFDVRWQKRLLTEVLLLARLSFWKIPYQGKDEKKKTEGRKKTLVVVSRMKANDLKKVSDATLIEAESMDLVRTLAALPSNFLSPRQYVKEVEKRSRMFKYKTEFFDRKQLEKMGAGAFLAVTQGKLDDDSGILKLTYRPAKKAKKKLALIGKGVCFDTGGYNIKTGSYMYSMHRDMTGSAVALGVFEALMRQRAPVEVEAYLALGENLISHKAYRPNDVVRALDGTSIEVVDTDAEGRMLLSDTLALARKGKPDLALEFSTLTGAAIRAVGTRRAAVFSNREKLREDLQKLGSEIGERVWGFPLGEDYAEDLKSEVADIAQCKNGPGPDHIYAATFLSRFIGDETPWIHVDLSCEENPGGLGLVTSAITGFGVRLGLHFSTRYLTGGGAGE